MSNLIIHILLYAFVVYMIGLAIRWWSKREDAHAAGILWLGLFTIIGASIILLSSIFGYISLSDVQKTGFLELSESDEIELMWIILAIFLLLALWRISEIVAETMRLIMIKRTSWGSAVGLQAFHFGDKELCDFEKKRILLQEVIRDETSNKKVVLRWSSRIQLPFTVGIYVPNVYVPLWAISKKTMVCVEQLVYHECEHINSRHNLWIGILRPVLYVIPFVEPIIKAIRHAFEADSDRKVMQKLDNESQKSYINTLETIVAPASGSGLEVGLGHDRKNIPLRIKQSVSGDRIKYQVIAISFFGLLFYAMMAAYLGKVDFSVFKKAFTRKIPANYAMVDVAKGAKIMPIVGDGGDISAGINIDTTACGADGRVVVGIGRSDARYHRDLWGGFRGSAFVEIQKTGKRIQNYPFLVGTGYKFENNLNGMMRAYVIDKDIARIDKSARYVTTIFRASSPSGEPGAMNWEIVVPSGWRVRLTDIRFAPYAGPERSVPQVTENQKMHRLLAPLGMERFDQAWDLVDRPFFAD